MPSNKNELLAQKRERHKYPHYGPYPRQGDIDWGDPDLAYPDNLITGFTITKRVFWVNPESVRGRLYVGEQEWDITDAVHYEALQFIQHDRDSGTETGKVVYVIAKEMYPHSTMSWEHVPIEEILPDWPLDIDFPDHSLVKEITRPEAKRLAVSMEQLWREKGGRSDYRVPKAKQGGWGSDRERMREVRKIR